MKRLVIIGFILFFLCVAYSFANTPAFWPGGVGSSWIYNNLNGEEISSVKGTINIGGKEYTQIQESGQMVSLLSGSTFDPWDWFAPKAIVNPFLVFRMGNDGSIYGYSRPYLEAMASEVKKYYEGVTDVSFPVGKDEILFYTPNETRFGGVIGWTVLKFIVKFQNGTKKTVEVIGTSSSFREMDGQEIQKENWPVMGYCYKTIDYYSSDKENPDIQDFFPFEGGRHLWEIYFSKRGMEGIAKRGIPETFFRKLISASLTPEQGKRKDIPPKGRTTATWGLIKSSQ